jgi:hypothetical protein
VLLDRKVDRLSCESSGELPITSITTGEVVAAASVADGRPHDLTLTTGLAL